MGDGDLLGSVVRSLLKDGPFVDLSDSDAVAESCTVVQCKLASSNSRPAADPRPAKSLARISKQVSSKYYNNKPARVSQTLRLIRGIVEVFTAVFDMHLWDIIGS